MNADFFFGVFAGAVIGWFLGHERGYLRRQREAADEHNSEARELTTVANDTQLWVVPSTELELRLQKAIRHVFELVGHSSQLAEADAIRAGDLVEADGTEEII